MSTLSRILRLAPKCQFGNVVNKSKLGMLQAIRPVTFTVQEAKPESKADHDEKNMNLKRPLSPHLTIYSRELQSFLSISHRFAGAAMTVYLMSFGLGTLILPQDISTYIAAIDTMNLPSPVLYAARILMVLPFTYHAINGMRHLVWDMGKLLHIKQVLTSGYIIVGLALLGAFALASE